MQKTLSKIFAIAVIITLLASLFTAVVPVSADGAIDYIMVRPADNRIFAATDYEIITTFSTLSLNDTITITFPQDTDISDVGLNDVYFNGESAIIKEDDTYRDSLILTFYVPGDFNYGTEITIVIEDVINPTVAGDYSLSLSYKWQTAVDSIPYTIIPPQVINIYNASGLLIRTTDDLDIALSSYVHAGYTVELGESVYEGNFEMNSGYDGVTLTAAGALEETIIKGSFVVEDDEAIISGITFKGALTVTGDDVTVDGCAFTKNVPISGESLFTNYASGLTISDCTFDTTLGSVQDKAFVMDTGATNSSLTGCTFTIDQSIGLTGDYAVYMNAELTASGGPPRVLSVTDCTFTGSSGFGYYDAIGNSYIYVNNNTFTSLESAVVLADASAEHIIIDSNDIVACTKDVAGAIQITAAVEAAITNNTFLYNTGYSIYSSASANLTITGNEFSGNAKGMYNADSVNELDAPNNYWGSASGPYHPDTNSSGTGDTVSDNIAYQPFLTSGFTTVSFADTNLEAAVREAINKTSGDIYRYDLLALTELNASGSNIIDLAGLEYCSGLQTLDLSTNQISDVSPLYGLSNLQTLDLGNNQITDIAALVANSGLNTGDNIDLTYNYLDIYAGSADMVDTETLIARGVNVLYDPQIIIFVDVTVNAPDTAGTDSDFVVSIDISQVTDLNSAQYDITYDDAVLRLDDITNGTIGSTNIPATSDQSGPGNYRIVNLLGLGTATGSGTLAVLHFHVIGEMGQTTDISITDGMLISPSHEIAANWTGDTVAVMEKHLVSITVAPAAPTIAKGRTQQFTATGTYSDNTTADLTGSVTWSSSDTDVATIDVNGLAVTHAEGSSSITATQSTVTSDVAVLTVAAAELDTLIVTPDSLNVAFVAGNPPVVQFTATGVLTDMTTVDVTADVLWSSSEESVATFGETPGLAATQGAGTTNITAVIDETISNTSVLIVSPDIIAPGLKLDYPADGTIVNSTALSVTGSVDGVAAVSLIVNDVETPLGECNGQFTADITLQTGDNTIQAKAVDSADNIGLSGIKTVTVDEAALVLITITSPADGTIVSSGALTIEGNATDTDEVVPKLNGTNLSPVSVAGGKFTTGITLVKGENTISVLSYDEADVVNGNSGTITVTYDNTAPDIALALTTYSDTLHAEVTSDEKLANLSVAINTDPVIELTMSRSGEEIWSGFSVPLPDGDYVVTATATDLAGNISIKTNDFSKYLVDISTVHPDNPEAVVGDPSKVELTVDSAIVLGDIDISIVTHINNPSGSTGYPSTDTLPAGIFLDIEVSQALKDAMANGDATVIITIHYDPDQLASGTSETSLTLYYWNTSASSWEAIDCVVNDTENTITATLPHCSVFGVFGSKASSGGGGGGGGGGSALYTVKLTGLSSDTTLKVDSSGYIQSAAQLKSTDGNCILDIADGARLLTSAQQALQSMTVAAVKTPPASPSDSVVVMAYNFGPDGAAFHPGLIMAFIYDKETLPENVEEANLYIAYWDGSQWETVNSTLDTQNHKITAQLTHFSRYGVLGKMTVSTTTEPVVTSTTATTTSVTTTVIPQTTPTTSTTKVAVMTTTLPSTTSTTPSQGVIPSTSTTELDRTAEKSSNVPLIIGIVIGILAAGVVVLVILRKRLVSQKLNP